MSLTENILFSLIGAHSAALIWLCCERDLIRKRLEMLEIEVRYLSQKTFDITQLQDALFRDMRVKKIKELEMK